MPSLEENKCVLKILSDLRDKVQVRVEQLSAREEEARTRMALHPTKSKVEGGWVKHWGLERAGHSEVLCMLNLMIESRTKQMRSQDESERGE